MIDDTENDVSSSPTASGKHRGPENREANGRNPYREESERYRKLGLASIPLKDKSKQPNLGELAPYLSRKATSEEMLSWESKWGGIGIVTGKVSEVIVLDVDGPEGEEELKRRGWNHTATAMAKTGNGMHMYFKHPGGEVHTSIGIAPGLDVKAEGGYVVAPPSVHQNGKKYEWIIPPEEGFEECPKWLLEAVQERPAESSEPLDGPIYEGTRNTTLASLAGSMRSRGLPQGVIQKALHVVNRSECQPPLPDSEVDSIARSIARYDAPGMQGALAHGGAFSPEAAAEAALTFTKLGRFIEEDAEPIEELIPGLLYNQKIHSVYGQAGHGKTIAALWMCLELIKKGLAVIYIDEENGPRRVGKLLRSFGVGPEEFDALFHYAHAPGLTLRRESRETWLATLEEVKPALVVFDSLTDMLALEGLNENDSVEVTRWVKSLCEPAKWGGAAVLILDHVTKDGAGKFARGSGAKPAKVDVAWKLKLNRPFDCQSTGKITLFREKDRDGQMPEKRKFTVGGDGSGNLLFSPEETTDERTSTGRTTNNEQYALKVLKEKFPEGAKVTEWQHATEEKMSSSTFYKRLRKLRKGGYVYKDEGTGRYLPSPASQE